MKATSSADRMLRLLGAALLLAAGGIHLDLYLTGYHSIPTIGPLFLLQVISAFALALAVVVSGQWLVALSGALFALSTLIGYSISRISGLLGFHEVRTTAGTVSGLIEVATIVVLGSAALNSAGSLGKPFRAALPAVVAVALIGFVVVDVTATAGTHSSPEPHATASTTGHEIHVTIKNFAFEPAQVVAQPDETIVVTNDDSVAHTLTAMPGSVPLGHFDTGMIQPGGTKRFDAPALPGSYRYYCQIHNFMTGVLIVKG